MTLTNSIEWKMFYHFFLIAKGVKNVTLDYDKHSLSSILAAGSSLFLTRYGRRLASMLERTTAR